MERIFTDTLHGLFYGRSSKGAGFFLAGAEKKPRRRSLCAGAKVQGHGRSQSQKELPPAPALLSSCPEGSGVSESSGVSG